MVWRRWSTPTLMHTSRPRPITLSLRALTHTRTPATRHSGIAYGRYSTLALVTEPNRRAVSTSNSLGVSRRCMKVETEPRPPPMMMPTSSITCMLPERPRSSQPYSSTDSATIATTCSRNCSVSCSIVTPATPRKYTAAVWIAVYRDSKPMIDGVMMRLLVTVWKAMVAVAWQNAATPTTTSEVTRISAISQKPLEQIGRASCRERGTQRGGHVTGVQTCALPISPATPRKYTAAVWIAVYRDSKPMIDGVMMRLLVTVWKAMVAVAWQNAATPMTTSEVPRISAISQKPLEPTGIGLPTASRPSAKPPAIRTSAVRTIQ